jgi:hypothetical protein
LTRSRRTGSTLLDNSRYVRFLEVVKHVSLCEPFKETEEEIKEFGIPAYIFTKAWKSDFAKRTWGHKVNPTLSIVGIYAAYSPEPSIMATSAGTTIGVDLPS